MVERGRSAHVRRALGALAALAVQRHRVILNQPALLLGDQVLAFFDLGVVELLDLAASRTHEVVMVLAFVEFVDGLAAFEVAAQQDAGLLELRENAVNGCKADVGTFFQQYAENVFSRHVTLLSFLEDVEDLQSGKRRFEAGAFQFVNIGHDKVFRLPSGALRPGGFQPLQWADHSATRSVALRWFNP
ncbi:hypothetical protein SDC9_77845 [bioreactor metagenome]|uniref:Uncharacterized protein n=1 Tax=bioreactor metagenome TaxID=1076179 RepID=A0A644YRY5_9ZZZZ